MQTEQCNDVPVAGSGNQAFHRELAIGSDGAPYFFAHPEEAAYRWAVYRWSEGRQVKVQELPAQTDPWSFRRSAGTLWARLSDGVFYEVTPTKVIAHEKSFGPPFGTPDDHVYAQSDGQEEKVNPGCSDALFFRCDRQWLWFQTVWFRSVKGRSTEIGHENAFDIAQLSVVDGEVFLLSAAGLRKLAL